MDTHGVSESEGKAWGSGQFANMPQDVKMQAYPKASNYRGRPEDDTITGIDSVCQKSESTASRYLSNQK